MEALLHPHITDLPGHIQAIFVQNIIKLYASILVKAEAEVWEVLVIFQFVIVINRVQLKLLKKLEPC